MSLAVTSDPVPMGEMNMTPLIDVMLVLLILFILTIPIQTHAVKVDLPSGPPPEVPIDRVKNEVVITHDGLIRWNGAEVTQPELSSLLAASQRLPTEPELHLRPEPLAKYALVDEVLSLTKRAHVRRMGFIGNEAYAGF